MKISLELLHTDNASPRAKIPPQFDCFLPLTLAFINTFYYIKLSFCYHSILSQFLYYHIAFLLFRVI